MRETKRPRAWLPYAAAAWSLIFAVFHVLWASGWYIALDSEQARTAFRRPLFFAYDVVVAAICFIGFLVALALVQSWGRRVPYRLLRLAAWTGTGLLCVRVAGSLIQSAYLLRAGRLTLTAIGIWEPWFYLGALLFALTTWRYARPATPMRG